ncbi:hypothetical protein FQN54_006083 [Arachnomyces sp. PD_36]|nr:hypothetical protein FQN54_006083 [Arachnomyces sp. PD_36]
MPFDTPSTLKTEISKLAKRTNVQNGLPPSMRGLPVLAIMAGRAIAKATNGTNAIEDKMLGTDETVLLAGPIEKEQTSHKQEPEARTGEMRQPDGT